MMSKRIIIVISLFIIWPMVFGFLYLNPPEFIPSLTDNYQAPACNFDQESPLLDPTSGCICPQIAISDKGFPIRVTGYGHCGLGKNNRAARIDGLVLIASELILVGVLAVVARKDRQFK